MHEVGLGPDQMKPDQDGNTPSEMARLEGHLELAGWLRKFEIQEGAGLVMGAFAEDLGE